MDNAVPESVVDAGVDKTPAPAVTPDDAVATVGAENVEVATAPSDRTSDETGGVLQQVEARTRARRRRRGAPPGWTLWMAKQAGNSRTFFSHTLPIWLMSRREELLSYAVSVVVLSFIAFLMAMCALPDSTAEEFFGLIITREEPDNDKLEVVELETVIQPDSIVELDANSSLKQMISNLEDGDTSQEIMDIVDKDFSVDLAVTDAEVEAIFKKGEYGGRSSAGRQTAVKRYGGTAESEKAVNSGLKWLK